MLLAAYRAFTRVAGVPGQILLARRARQGREDLARIGERFGNPSAARPTGKLAWVHAASIGEAVSALALIERLHGEWRMHVLVTTGTVTSAAVLGARLPVGAVHQFVPLDLPYAVDRFLDHWRPDLALWIESELWPNLLLGAQARGIPCVLLNARMSERSYARWLRVPRTAKRLMSAFRLCLARTDQDAHRFARLGAEPVRHRGDLKDSAQALPVDAAALAEFAGIAGRPVWLAASTHDPEEMMIGRIHLALKDAHPGLLTILVPRHPERSEVLATALQASGLSVARHSRREYPGPDCDIFLGDTVGELGLFYRLAGIAFIGRSLGARGGQNPLEAARLGCAVLYGPHMENVAELAADMASAGAALIVADEQDLELALDRLLADAEERARRQREAVAYAQAKASVLDAVMQELAPFLEDVAA